MKKSILLLTGIVSLFSFQAISQQVVLIPERTFSREMGMNTAEREENPDIEGSKYIYPLYQQATLSTHPNILFNVRYNAYNDDMEVQGKENNSYAINKYSGTVIVALVNGDNYINSKYTDKNEKINTGFFKVLNTSGDFFLLKKETITIKEKEVAKTTYHKSKPAKYVKISDEYYIKINNLTAKKAPKKSKDFANLFPENKEAILSFIKSEKIKLKKEEDLIKVFKHIENLKKESK
jgi:hypothetical protein